MLSAHAHAAGLNRSLRGTQSSIYDGASTAPASRPLALVEIGQRLTHQPRLVDEQTPTQRPRPAGVECAEVFVALTVLGQPAPNDPREYRYIGCVLRGETTLRFDVGRRGTQAHWLASWVTRHGVIGPWSETARATVAA